MDDKGPATDGQAGLATRPERGNGAEINADTTSDLPGKRPAWPQAQCSS